MLAQLIPVPGPQGQTLPQWIQLAAWPVVSANDWCGRFTKSQAPDIRSIEQRLKDAGVPNGQS